MRISPLIHVPSMLILAACNGGITTAPAPDPAVFAPRDLGFSARSSGSLSFTWTNAEIYDAIRVQRASSAFPTPDEWVDLSDLPGTTVAYLDQGLTPGASYTYCLIAQIGELWSTTSATLTIQTDVLPNVSLLAATANSISLVWSYAGDPATRFLVGRSPNVEPPQWTEIADLAATTTSLVDSGLEAATAYLYRVQAVVTPERVESSSVLQANTNPLLAWTVHMPGTSGVWGVEGMQVDGSGRVYVFGRWGRPDLTADFGTSNQPDIRTVRFSNRDLFARVYDADGDHLVTYDWGTNDDYLTYVSSFDVADDGSWFVTGPCLIPNSLLNDLDPTPGLWNPRTQAGVNRPGDGIPYILGMRGDGTFRGASIPIAGPTWWTGGWNVTYSAADGGAVYWTNGGDGRIRKNDMAMTQLWEFTAQPSFAATPWVSHMNRRIATLSNGDLVVLSTFSGTIDADYGAGTDNRMSAGGTDVAILRVSGVDASYVSARTFGGPGNETVDHIGSDRAGNLYISGLFQGTVNFNTSGGTPDTKTAEMAVSYYITKYNADFSYGWTFTISSDYTALSGRLIERPSGDLVYTGAFRGMIKFDTSGQSVTKTCPNGTASNCEYLLALSPDGQRLGQGVYGYGLGYLDFMPSGEVVFAKTFTGNVNLNDWYGLGDEPITYSGGAGGNTKDFVVKVGNFQRVLEHSAN